MKKLSVVPVSEVNKKLDFSCCEPIQYNTVRDLYINEFKGSSTGEDIYSFADDIQLLLMQKNFDKLNDLRYHNFLRDMSLSGSLNVRKVEKPKMTDKQLMSYVKSRHIQSASELCVWMNYLNSRYEIVKENSKQEVKDELEKVRNNGSSGVSGNSGNSDNSGVPGLSSGE